MSYKHSSMSASGVDQRRRKGQARKVRRPQLSAAEITAIEQRINERSARYKELWRNA